MTERGYAINIWINEERYVRLRNSGLLHMRQEMYAGLSVVKVYASGIQKDRILQIFPSAKFDSATTKSIELLPRDVKDDILGKVIERQHTDILEEFLSAY